MVAGDPKMALTREIRWILTGQNPDQIPMGRLADYMKQLALLMGARDKVHFARVEKGSTALIAQIKQGQPFHAVQSRLKAVREGTAPADARKAYDDINVMVGQDVASAKITLGSCTILRFPGVSKEFAEAVVLHDEGTITGKLYAMAENSDGIISARIKPRIGARYVPCTVDKSLAKELRGYLLEAVRVHGMGAWRRSADSLWTCESFNIKQVSAVKDVNLRQAITELRSIDADWPEDPLSEWAETNERGDAA